MINDNNLIWMDLEFTGLSDDQVIIETACIITDKNLEILEEGPNLVINRSEKELEIIEDWPLKIHTKSGLLDSIINIDCKKLIISLNGRNILFNENILLFNPLISKPLIS